MSALLTKLVKSRWLHIGQVLYYAFIDRDKVYALSPAAGGEMSPRSSPEQTARAVSSRGGPRESGGNRA